MGDEELDLAPMEIATELPPPLPEPEALPDPTFWDSAYLWDMPIAASSLCGLLLATVGIYVVLARAAFVSAAVSQLTGLGVVAAFLLGGGLAAGSEAAGMETTARFAGLGLGVLGAGLFALPTNLRRTSVDALLAVAVIAASALTLVGAGFLTRDYQHVKNALYGDAVVAEAWEVWLIGGVALVILVGERFYRQRFVLVLFDADTASAQGMRVRGWLAALGLGISLSVALSTASVGALPAFAFTVLPATCALLLTSRLDQVFWIANSLAVFAATVGYYLAFELELPVGPAMCAMLLLPLAGTGLWRAVHR